ncbi:MAG: NAD(P)H-dependent oxidoreductase subunit E [Acidimicrobiia bacterium]|nr:NAD(P)H-dependent oxidoreductase subunit E [Acidimicrobiia bacterium]
MDLKLMATQPTDAERSAVDGLLGPPTDGWTGGERTEADLHIARGGHSARGRRHLLLPALWALQDRIGWISPGGMNYVCRRLTVPPAEAYGVATFYALFSTTELAGRVAHICDDVACLAAGAAELCSQVEAVMGPEGTGDKAAWMRSPCLGMCDRAPAALYQFAGGVDRTAGPISVEQIQASLGAALPGPGKVATPPGAAGSDLRLLRRVGTVGANLDDYIASGGYTALTKAVAMGPQGVVDEVAASGLLGRGGAAFPTGRKWAAVAAEEATPKYVVCNADESEPGTFKDRLLMDADPFAIIEAMTIAAVAVGAEHGYIYIRGEYPETTRTLEGALAAASQGGYLGADAAGSGSDFDIEIRQGAGAYICGEETAMLESMEGKRGEPRQKPPYPNQHGLFGQPTLINNVETLANIPHIINDGASSFRSVGTSDSTGTRLFCLSGTVDRPGVYEVALGTTLRDVLMLAMDDVDSIQAVLLGGAAGSFVTADSLDIALSHEAAQEAGVTLGSGAIVVFDETIDMAAVVARIARFFRDESCGQCVPCRVGTVRQEEALTRLTSGSAEVALLAEIGEVMAEASICGLGHTASAAVQSAIDLGLVGS